MQRKQFTTVLLAIFVVCATGCATLPYTVPLPEGSSVRKLGSADADTPFALSRKGFVAAVSGGTLEIIRIADGTVRKVAAEGITAVSFSPNGEKLALGTAEKGGNFLSLCDPDGALLARTEVTGRVIYLGWLPDQNLLAGSLLIKKFSFGSEMITEVYRWDGKERPAPDRINDITVRRRIDSWPEELLYGTFSMALSPYGDEIAFKTLKDPPLMAPYQLVLIRHLETCKQREITPALIGSDGPIYAPDGESIIIGGVEGKTRRLSLPEAKEIAVIGPESRHLAGSPNGSYLLSEGIFYEKERKSVTFPPEVRGVFSPDGTGLVLSYRGTLYLFSGLKDGPPPPPPKDPVQLLKLRRLRSLGLITNEEFNQEKERSTTP